jgi:hypothetical protein
MSIVEDGWQAIWNSLVHALPLLSSIDLVVSTNKLQYMTFFVYCCIASFSVVSLLVPMKWYPTIGWMVFLE